MLSLWLLLPLVAAAQSEYFVIDQCIFTGNAKTKNSVIERELDFVAGDTIWVETLSARLDKNKKQILSTGLFSYAEISIKDWVISANRADLVIALQENWYIYAFPVFDLADRSFNVWWQDQGRSLDRINYGIRIDHINTTGNYDRLKLKAHLGYTRKYEIAYSWPYLNKSDWGIETNVLFAESRELAYATIDNRPAFYSAADSRRLDQRWRAGLAVRRRPNIYRHDLLRLEYHHRSVDDFVIEELNPAYFGSGKAQLQYLLLAYTGSIDRRVYWQYPQGGYRLSIDIRKDGLGVWDEINNLSITGEYEVYGKIGQRLIWGSHLVAKRQLTRGPIAYINNQSLGYGTNIVRGYELYVMDGLDLALARSQLSYDLLHTVVDNKVLPLKQYRKIDVQVYLRWTTDVGYAHEPTYTATNTLNNRLLIGYGPAIDFIIANTVIGKIEYNWNHLGEGGLYIKSNTAF